jgi:hypothetical protein
MQEKQDKFGKKTGIYMATKKITGQIQELQGASCTTVYQQQSNTERYWSVTDTEP